MLNSKDLFRDLRKRITLEQEMSETDSLTYLILESILGLTRSDILVQKAVSLTSAEVTRLDSIIQRTNQQEPIQYILGHAYFYGRPFSVNPSVLIPRPETELLIDEVVKYSSNKPGKVLDIGTGSGCIAITLALEFPKKEIIALDVSEAALRTASANANQLNAHVDFQCLNILKEPIPVQDVECIVSNPPYVAEVERGDMNKNVLEYEPHVALFVPDNDPLIFYRAIAIKGFPVLQAGGRIVVEINERFGKEACEVFMQAGFSKANILKDLQGKDRIVTIVK